ncbi:MAG: type II toxin-antitoxin system VapC family toxin [Planctomycetota bacterium]|nr:type II toxin-antitoxin system VapC family toxin [Planctomycetota bacterium]MDA1214779.1 type II toxin-antitoxin system VapC family toxin [Planctomycetota bacterium]
MARPSRDIVVAAHQQITRDWWDYRHELFKCSISQVVIDEASAGDSREISKRLDVIRHVPVLEITASAEQLAKAIIASGVIPPRAVRDAAHIAVAAVHEVDFLLTWNCKHLANAQFMRKIKEICETMGEQMP